MAIKDYLNKDEAFWLPKGSIRAIMALVLIGAVTYLSIYLKNMDFISSLAGAAIGYYFGAKNIFGAKNNLDTTIKE